MTQPPDLAALAREIDLPVEKPAAWWVRWDVIPIVCCVCILIFVGHAVGEF